MCGEHSPCSGHTGLPRSRVSAFPVYTAPAPGCSIWSGPCGACGSSFRVLHKSADSVGPAFCAFPGRSSSGSLELDGGTLPGAMCFVPSGVPASVSPRASRVRAPCVCSGELASSRDPSSRRRPSRISGSLWEPANRLGACLQFGRECRLWGQVCPFPLPPASCLRRGGPVRRRLALLWDPSVPLFCEQPAVCSGRLIFSLSCYPTV